jgi:hypothetical protein
LVALLILVFLCITAGASRGAGRRNWAHLESIDALRKVLSVVALSLCLNATAISAPLAEAQTPSSQQGTAPAVKPPTANETVDWRPRHSFEETGHTAFSLLSNR